MLTPAHLPELERLLVEHAEARDAYAAACADGSEGTNPSTEAIVSLLDVIDAASVRESTAARALAAFTRRVQGEAVVEPAGMEEIERAVVDFQLASENAYRDEQSRLMRRRRNEAHDELLMLIRSALAARDERTAALTERAEAAEGALDAHMRGAAEWRDATWSLTPAEAKERIAALEAGLREACDLYGVLFARFNTLRASSRLALDSGTPRIVGLRALADGAGP